MDWHLTIFELIDLSSFSNLWFWIALAVMWSSASHWVIGVPWDMVTRARRNPQEGSEDDLLAMIRIMARRIDQIARQSGLLLAGLTSFVLTCLILLGFVYDTEVAQALFLLGFPMTIVSLMSVGTARAILRDIDDPRAIFLRMQRHRLFTQVIGMVSIFVTAMWGMLQNILAGYVPY